jgi:hypothetical protein
MKVGYKKTGKHEEDPWQIVGLPTDDVKRFIQNFQKYKFFRSSTILPQEIAEFYFLNSNHLDNVVSKYYPIENDKRKIKIRNSKPGIHPGYPILEVAKKEMEDYVFVVNAIWCSEDVVGYMMDIYRKSDEANILHLRGKLVRDDSSCEISTTVLKKDWSCSHEISDMFALSR